MDDRDLLAAAADAALSYVGSVDDRPTTPTPEALAALAAFDEPLPDGGRDPLETLRMLGTFGWPGHHGVDRRPLLRLRQRCGVEPVALSSAWLASAWDQNAALPVMSPVAARLHRRGPLVVEVLRLPAETGVAFVTGATVANAACLAAARDALLARMGWDVQADGLFGAPPLPVVIGERAHSTLAKSLGLVGLGRARVHVVPPTTRAGCAPTGCPTWRAPCSSAHRPGRSTPARSTRSTRRRLAGRALRLAARRRGVRAVGAGRPDPFAPRRRAGAGRLPGHRPAQVAQRRLRLRPRVRARARGPPTTFTAAAGYLPDSAEFEAMHHTPQSSQRARQIEVWAVLRTLGRDGVAELVTRTCAWPGRSPTGWPRAGSPC